MIFFLLGLLCFVINLGSFFGQLVTWGLVYLGQVIIDVTVVLSIVRTKYDTKNSSFRLDTRSTTIEKLDL